MRERQTQPERRAAAQSREGAREAHRSALEALLGDPQRGVGALAETVEQIAYESAHTASWEKIAEGWTQLLAARESVSDGEMLTVWMRRIRSENHAPAPPGMHAIDYEADLVRAGWPTLAWSAGPLEKAEENVHGAETRWADLWASALERERERGAHAGARELDALTELMCALFAPEREGQPAAPPEQWTRALEEQARECENELRHARKESKSTDTSNSAGEARRRIARAVCALVNVAPKGETLRARIEALGIDGAPGERAVRDWANGDEAIETVLAHRAGLAWTGGKRETQAPTHEHGTDTTTIMLIVETGVDGTAILKRSAGIIDTSWEAVGDACAGLVRTKRREGFAFEMMEAFEPAEHGSPFDEGTRIAMRAGRGGPRILAIAIDAVRQPDEQSRRETEKAIAKACRAWGEHAPVVTLIGTAAERLAASQLDAADANARATRVATLTGEIVDLSALLRPPGSANRGEDERSDEEDAAALRSLAHCGALGEAWRVMLAARRWLVPALERAGVERIEGAIVGLKDKTAHGMQTLWRHWWDEHAPSRETRRTRLENTFGKELEQSLARAARLIPCDLECSMGPPKASSLYETLKQEIKRNQNALATRMLANPRNAETGLARIASLARRRGAMRELHETAQTIVDTAQSYADSAQGAMRRRIAEVLEALGIDGHRTLESYASESPDSGNAPAGDEARGNAERAERDGAKTHLEFDPLQGAHDDACRWRNAPWKRIPHAAGVRTIIGSGDESVCQRILRTAGSEAFDDEIEPMLRLLAHAEPKFPELTLARGEPNPVKYKALRHINASERTERIIEYLRALHAAFEEFTRPESMADHARWMIAFEVELASTYECGFNESKWEDAIRNESATFGNEPATLGNEPATLESEPATLESESEKAHPWERLREKLRKCQRDLVDVAQKRTWLARVSVLFGRELPWKVGLENAHANVFEYGELITQRTTKGVTGRGLREDENALAGVLQWMRTIEAQEREGVEHRRPRPGWTQRLDAIREKVEEARRKGETARTTVERDILRERCARALALEPDKPTRMTIEEIERELRDGRTLMNWSVRREKCARAIWDAYRR